MVLSMERWEGKVAVVTGASSGIGAAIVEKLVDEGMKVVGLARRKNKIEALSKKLQGKNGELFPVKCDITIEADIIKAFKWTTEKLGPISVLVNNAGIYRDFDLTSGSTDIIKAIWETNVLGLTIATREALKSMKENNVNGHIIHINSTAGHATKFSQSGVYSSSKYAVTSLTEALRIQLVELGSKTKVTSISPGVVDTEILHTLPPEVTREMPKLKPEDIADSVVYVLSTPLGVQVHELLIKPTGEKW